MQSTDDVEQVQKQVLDLKKQYAKALLNVVRNLCDLPVIFYFMKHGPFSQTLAGCLGTCSSAISLYGLYGAK